MCDLTEVDYLPGQVVWVKFGNCWWPGEVKEFGSLPEDMVKDFKKKPLAVVKFFGEEAYEYVKTLDHIYHYNNRRKMEFIKKGMDLYRSKTKQGLSSMDKFPTDVVTAETLSGGNINILKSPAFVPEEKVDYKELFESPKKRAKKMAEKASTSSPRATPTASSNSSAMAKVNHIIQIKQRITHPRFVNESDHEIRIRQQPVAQDSDGITHAYKCQECDFGTNRQNLFILHCKAHRDQEKAGIVPPPTMAKPAAVKTATQSARAKKAVTPRPPPTKKIAATSTPKPKVVTPKTESPKAKRDKSEAKEAAKAAREIFQAPKKGRKGAIKTKFPPKTDEELAKEQEKRNNILADWDEDEQEEELEIKKMKLDTTAESTSSGKDDAELDKSGSDKEKEPKSPEKEVPSADASSVYDIIEEPEAIVPPPSRESKEDKELSKEKEKFNKEVEDLLMETSLPSLPDVPSLPNIPLKKSEKGSPTVTEPALSKEEHKEELAGETKSETPKVNGESTAATEEAVTVTPNVDSAVDPNTETATYVLVTVDEGGFHQLSGLEGMGTTLYIDPAQLAGSGTSLDNLYLAIDEGSMAQLDQQQVALQMGADLAKTTQQDILAAALANTQVLQTTAVDSLTGQMVGASEAVVKVTNTTQTPVMTPRVAESSLSSSVNNGSAGNAMS